MEKLIYFGFLICFESFLFTLTILPLRVLKTLFTLMKGLLFRKNTPIVNIFSDSQIFDILRMFLFIVSFSLLCQVDASVIYHNIRGQSVVKLYVIFNVLEIIDRLCCSFGQDIFDSLFLVFSNKDNGHTTPTISMFGHVFIAIVYIIIHSFVLLFQAVTLNVAINSYNNALLTLLLSNQFIELKGAVFKRFLIENLFQVACSDIVERFQFFIFLFIVSFNNCAALGWDVSLQMIRLLLASIITVWLSEIIVDSIKHAFVTKFNMISPDFYKKFRWVLCLDLKHSLKKNVDTSNSVSKRIGFVPIPLAALTLRVFIRVFPITNAFGCLMGVLCFVALFLAKIWFRIILLGKSLALNLSEDDIKELSSLGNIFRYTMYRGRIP